MPDPMTRRSFHHTLAAGAVAAAAGAAMAADKEPPKPTEAPFERDYPPPKFTPSFKKPLVNLTLARDFVIFAHSDLDMVKTLLAKEPALLNATVDWGGGDYESALGGAAHTGGRDIAEFLLSKGARLDVFCAAMLGQLDAVKALLTAMPHLIDAKGPHGIPLIMHAKMGGDPAKPVLDYLQSLKPKP